jgi:hypothetical protein
LFHFRLQIDHNVLTTAVMSTLKELRTLKQEEDALTNIATKLRDQINRLKVRLHDSWRGVCGRELIIDMYHLSPFVALNRAVYLVHICILLELSIYM